MQLPTPKLSPDLLQQSAAVGAFSIKYLTHHDFKYEWNMLYKTTKLNLFNCWFIDIFSSGISSVSSVVRYGTFLINVSHLHLFLFFSRLRS